VCGGGGGLTRASTGRERKAGGAGGGGLPELDAEEVGGDDVSESEMSDGEPHDGRATAESCLKVALETTQPIFEESFGRWLSSQDKGEFIQGCPP
jgi:hypothetical protein